MSLLVSYTKPCKDTVGKLKRVYLAIFVDYDENEIVEIDGVLYTFPDTMVYQYDVDGSYNQKTGLEGGDYYWEQDVSINLAKVYGILNQKAFTKYKYRIIAETNNGIYLMFGLMNGMECELTNQSGTDKTDFNGFSLTFKGKEDEAAMPVDFDGFYEVGNDLFFSYDLSFSV